MTTTLHSVTADDFDPVDWTPKTFGVWTSWYSEEFLKAKWKNFEGEICKLSEQSLRELHRIITECNPTYSIEGILPVYKLPYEITAYAPIPFLIFAIEFQLPDVKLDTKTSVMQEILSAKRCGKNVVRFGGPDVKSIVGWIEKEGYHVKTETDIHDWTITVVRW